MYIDQLIDLNKEFYPIKFHKVEYVDGDFFPHVEIEKGEIIYDDEADDASLLHETGHLALLPNNIRGEITGDIDDSLADEEGNRFYATGNEGHIIVWQFYIVRQLGIPEYLWQQYQLLEQSDFKCITFQTIRNSANIYNELKMGFNFKKLRFDSIVCPI